MRHSLRLLYAYLILAALMLAVIFLRSWEEGKKVVPPDMPAPSAYLPSLSAIFGDKGRREAKLLFVGDMMFDRTIRTVGSRNGYDYLFSCIKPYLSEFDAVFGNLEGTITHADSVSAGTVPGQPGNTTFTFSPLVAPVLASNGFKAVSLGNNHSFDLGAEGLQSTIEILSDAGIAPFGAPRGAQFATTTVSGNRIALVSFNQFMGENDPGRTIGLIRQLRADNDFVAVFAHWGDEYLPENDLQIVLAHQFIDAGADTVIGAHPHIIQSSETYEGKPIYYSLGNFIFDQYWNEAVRTGQGVEVSMKDGRVSFSTRTLNIQRDGRTCVSEVVDK